MGAMAPVVIR